MRITVHSERHAFVVNVAYMRSVDWLPGSAQGTTPTIALVDGGHGSAQGTTPTITLVGGGHGSAQDSRSE